MQCRRIILSSLVSMLSKSRANIYSYFISSSFIPIPGIMLVLQDWILHEQNHLLLPVLKGMISDIIRYLQKLYYCISIIIPCIMEKIASNRENCVILSKFVFYHRTAGGNPK